MRGIRAAVANGSELRRLTRRLARLAALLLSLPHSLPAQSVTPPIAEYQERARSSFRLTNGTLYPLNVVLDVRGFRVTDAGEVIDEPLDTSRVHVRLSAMSFRIPPRGAYTVFYEADTDSLPAWFNIVSAMTGARADNGLNVRILLPHVVYLNQKHRLQADDVVVRALEVDTAAHRVRVRLENLGPRLGRVLELTASDGGRRSPPGGGFPLFPHRSRWVEAAWEGTALPNRVTVRTARFTLDTTLTAVLAGR
ncbi:MAG TPA: hypothetical protein VF046_02205 [Gemmatimonadales bacterium]